MIDSHTHSAHEVYDVATKGDVSEAFDLKSRLDGHTHRHNVEAGEV